MEPMTFDACIDLGGNVPRAAVTPVREAIEALPGAGWISVAWLGAAPGYQGDLAHLPAERWIRIWRPGSRSGGDPAWDELRRTIRARVLAVLAAAPTGASS